jgi:hypothetical protein
VVWSAAVQFNLNKAAVDKRKKFLLAQVEVPEADKQLLN